MTFLLKAPYEYLCTDAGFIETNSETLCVCVCVCVCVCMYTRAHAYVYTLIHTYLRIYVFFNVLFIFERARVREGQKEWDRRFEVGSALTAASPMQGLNSLTVRL